ncbi:MAG: arylsulfatase [Kiritimatiellae bacterium]|nr:arylsulfatase [Kiritimatiellia bacterium]
MRGKAGPTDRQARESGVDGGPNIVVILADDMGYSDIGCFGSEIRTPHLDSMAADGVRFTQMYNCARCCPTRASLLTGLYPHQAGVGLMIGDSGVGPAYQGYLRAECVTIGEVLRERGYGTYYCGKWHASPGLPLRGEPIAEPGTVRNPNPLSRGFDRFYGTLAGCANYFNPHALMDQDRRVAAVDEGYYYTDAISARACGMLDEAAAGGKPFFLHVCYTAPHWPLHARAADIERYRGTYRRGWDCFRTARHEALKGAGILSDEWPISPRDPDSRDFADDSPDRREWEALRMAVYAAQVDSMDQGIGRILAKLAEHGLAQDTLVMFLSDNGGCAEFLREDGDGKSWPSLYRHTAPSGKRCVVGNIVGLEPGPGTTFMSYDLPWANVSNSPFRLYKHWVHEGGIATPFVVRWPSGARGGRLVHRPCHVIDIMATCLDAAGATYPRTYGGREIIPLEGESFMPLLAGKDTPRERPLFWEHHGNCAARDGEWKLVRRDRGEWELYNMGRDRTELTDLAQRATDQRDRLIGMYGEWARRCGVLDWPLKKTS